MGDVGKGSTVHDGGVVLQGLHEIGFERLAQQHRHGAMRAQVARAHRRMLAGMGDDDIAEALLQIRETGGQAEDRHDLGGHDDIEAVLPRKSVAGTTQTAGDLPQSAIIHVDHALPAHAAYVYAELVTVVDVIVDERGEQIVGQGDRAEIAREMQVDVLHGHDLRIAAARRAPLEAKHRTLTRFAQADDGFPAESIQRIAQSYRGRRFAFAGRRRCHGRDEDQFAVRSGPELRRILQRDLGLVAAVGVDRIGGDAERRGDLRNGPQRGPLRYLNIRQHADLQSRRAVCPASPRVRGIQVQRCCWTR